jgi:hypothetical protein
MYSYRVMLSSVVKILDIKRAKTCTGHGNGAVEENFSGREAGGLVGRGTREIETVAADATKLLTTSLTSLASHLNGHFQYYYCHSDM